MSVNEKELYNFRPMVINDLDDIYKLEIDSYAFPWTRAILRDCILYKYDSFCVFFDNNLIGYIISKISKPETHILNLTVNADFRKIGIGKSLIQLILNDARMRQSDDIILEVRADNYDAQSLYEKLNFKKVGIRKDYYESKCGRQDAYVLKLKL